MNIPKIVAIVGKDSGRLIVQEMEKMKVNLTDVFVKDEKYKINGSGFKKFDDLFINNKKINLHKIKYVKDQLDLLKEISPDLIIMNYSEVLPKEILNIPKRGVVGFHYAALPDRRGCNPDMWAVIHGLTESKVTFHFYDEKIDRGDIIDYENFDIGFEDDAQNVLDKINSKVVILLKKNLEKILNGKSSRIKQIGKGIYTPRRNFEDGEIFWSKMKAIDIYNLIRALRPPYAGAFSLCGPRGNKERLYLMKGIIADKKEIKSEEQIIDWKTYPEKIHKEVYQNKSNYALTGNGVIKILETRIGEIQE